MRSSLTAYAASMREPDPMDAYRTKKKAWQDHGIVMIDPDKDINWDGGYSEREMLKALANRLYGKRKLPNGKC